MNAITINNLTKIYASGTQALKNVDLEVESGDFFALIGANGAGKTTMIGILTGIVNKTSGNASVFGNNLDETNQSLMAKKLIGVVPQEINFNQFEKVQSIAVNQAGYFGIRRKRALTDSEILLKRLRLWDKRNEQARYLSGGMKRRLMIARALINHPKLLILDEPTASVDIELRHDTWDYLREINKNGTTILLTTHYMEEIEQLCKNAAIIKDGEIIHHDKVNRLLRLVNRTNYIITVKKMISTKKIQHLNPVVIDKHTLEVEISREESINDLMTQLSGQNISVVDIRPKENRLEKLFLNILKQ